MMYLADFSDKTACYQYLVHGRKEDGARMQPNNAAATSVAPLVW